MKHINWALFVGCLAVASAVGYHDYRTEQRLDRIEAMMVLQSRINVITDQMFDDLGAEVSHLEAETPSEESQR